MLLVDNKIIYFSGPYILGHIILGGWESKPALFIALALLALGAGSIKPNISTLMGSMYEAEGKQSLLNEAFSEPGGERLRQWIDNCPNQLYSALVFQGGAAWRRRLLDEIGDQGPVTRLIEG